MFTIRCTTCQAKLSVKNENLIGHILACPKCGGMVQVTFPEKPDSTNTHPNSSESTNSEHEQISDTYLHLSEKRISESPDSKSPKTENTNPEKSSEQILDNCNNQELSERKSPEQEQELPVQELRRRRILVFFLGGLIVFLILALGILVSMPKKSQDESPNSDDDPSDAIILTQIDKKIISETEKNTEIIANEKHANTSVTATKNVELPPKNLLRQNDIETKTNDFVREISEHNSTQNGVQNPKSNHSNIDFANENKENETKKPLSFTETEALKPFDSDTTSAAINETETAGSIQSRSDFLSELQRKLPRLIPTTSTFSSDIQSNLELSVRRMNFRETPLYLAVRSLSNIINVPVTFDVDQMRGMSVNISSRISHEVSDSKISEILQQILNSFLLEFVVEEKQITISTSKENREQLVEKTIFVDDLVSEIGDEKPEKLIDSIKRLISPNVWNHSDKEFGEAFLNFSDDKKSIQIKCTQKEQNSVLCLLEQIRVIRQLPQQTNLSGQNLAPEAFGWDTVLQPITLNYYQPTPLSEIFKQLEDRLKITILIDHKSIHRALSPFQTLKGTVQCNNGTLDEALTLLLNSVDSVLLSYRIIGESVLEITTQEAINKPEKMSVEVHRYVQKNSPLADETPEELCEIIRSALAPNSWYDSQHPETIGLGDIVIDRLAGCLIVRQSQPIQRQLRRWFGKRLESKQNRIDESRLSTEKMTAEDDDSEPKINASADE
ncbi:MAG: hypothetical protein ACRCUY_01100 [Thermoguttaceae bacterium]